MALSISFLGPLGTYSHQAVRGYSANHPVSLHPVDTIHNVCVSGVTHGRPLTAPPQVIVVPLDNSTKGRVGECMRCLATGSLFGQERLVIIGEFSLAISHALVVHSDNISYNAMDGVRAVWSHPQALGQCSTFLSKTLPHAERVPTRSTAEAVALLQEYPHDAAVASELAAELAGAAVLYHGIQDVHGNTTRFVAATCNPSDPAVAALVAHHKKVYHSGPAFRAIARITGNDGIDTLRGHIHGAVAPLRVTGIDEAEPLDGPATKKVLIVEVSGEDIATADNLTKRLAQIPGHVDYLGAWPVPSDQIPAKL